MNGKQDTERHEDMSRSYTVMIADGTKDAQGHALKIDEVDIEKYRNTMCVVFNHDVKAENIVGKCRLEKSGDRVMMHDFQLLEHYPNAEKIKGAKLYPSIGGRIEADGKVIITHIGMTFRENVDPRIKPIVIL